MATGGGGVWWPRDPRPEDVDWLTIGEALGKTPRFNGLTAGAPYSVAQHCMTVADALPPDQPDLQLAGLLHDAHEAIVGDLPHPVKATLHELGGGEAWDRLITAHDAAIYQAAGLPWPLPAEWRAAIHRADMEALATEMRDLQPEEPLCDRDLPDPWPERLKVIGWPETTDLWLQVFERLSGKSRHRGARG